MRMLRHHLRRISRPAMLAAALCFALQGVTAAHLAAAEPHAGLAVWHAHELEDGSRHVHHHPINDKEDGGHHDHDGKLKCCAAPAVFADFAKPPVIVPLTPAHQSYVLHSARIPSGPDPGGPQRPPRTPDIG